MHITRNHLDQIRRSLNIKEPDDLLFWVVALTAFYELAQLGELLPDRKSEKLKTPCLKAIKFEKVNQATFATIQLAKTKNHKSTIRTILVINSTNDRLCPIRLLKTYIIRRTSPNQLPIVTPYSQNRTDHGPLKGGFVINSSQSSLMPMYQVIALEQEVPQS